MYPLPAVLVNCPEPAAPELRAALAENSVAVVAEYPSTDELLAVPPSRSEARQLFIVRVGSLNEADQVGRVDAAFPGSPVLALVEGDYDAAALFRVSRSGASQLIPLPFTRADFGAALDRLMIQFGMQKTPCRVIAVGGVAEGCGATTAALNLAAEIPALSGVPCVLAELTRGLGRLAGLLNLAPQFTTADVFGGSAPNLVTLQSALARVDDRLSVLVGPYNSLATAAPKPGAVPQLVRLLRQTAGFVVLDVPATFDAEYFDVVGAADRLVLVARQDVPCIQAAKLLVEGLRERGLPDPVLLLNEYDPGRDLFTLDRTRERLGLRDVHPIHPDARGARAAANVGRPMRELDSTSPAVKDLRHVAIELLRDAGVPIHEPRSNVWKWVREKFGV